MPQTQQETLNKMISDPQFLSLSASGKRKALREVDPDFSKLSDSGIDEFLSRYSKSSQGGVNLGKVPERQTNASPDDDEFEKQLSEGTLPFTPENLAKVKSFIHSHPERFSQMLSESEKKLRSEAPPIIGGLATLPFGGEGIWPALLRIFASGASAGATDYALGGKPKEAAKTALEQGALQGGGEAAGSALKFAGSKLLKPVKIAEKEFPAIHGQAASTPTAMSKVASGLSESFVGGPISKKLAAQDTGFKALVSGLSESLGGVASKEGSQNFIENTFANSKALIDKASWMYDQVAEGLPGELTEEQKRIKVLNQATVFGGRKAGARAGAISLSELLGSASPEAARNIMASLGTEETEAIEAGLDETATPREKYQALQKLRSSVSQAANRAFQRGLGPNGTMADYAELSNEVRNLDGQISNLVTKDGSRELAKLYREAQNTHATARTLERFGVILDSLTSNVSAAEAKASGIPTSEIHPQQVNYGRLLEKIREFNQAGHFDTKPTLAKLFGDNGARDILRSLNLMSNVGRSNIGIIAHYLTTYGPALGAGEGLLRGRPEQALTSLAIYPAIWAVAKLMSYPSFSDAFGHFLLSGSGTKESALWLTRAVQAARAPTKAERAIMARSR